MGDSAERLIERVRATIASRNMLVPTDKVLVAVSGGPDSMALWTALEELGYEVHVAHFDHQTRDGESGRDADAVRKAALERRLPFHLESRPIAEESRTARMSFEAYARKARYEFFSRVAAETQCTAIATGHHADDRAETVMMRILRGTWPGGLAAIPPLRETQDGVKVVRPLIDCTREEILEYLRARNCAHSVDTSNADTDIFRNRVRHELLPALQKDYNPQVREALCRLAEQQADLYQLVREQTGAFVLACFRNGAIDNLEFAAGSIACQRELLADCAIRNGIEVHFDRIERARKFVLDSSPHKSFDFGGVLLRKEQEMTYFVRPRRSAIRVEVPLVVPGETPAFGQVFRCQRFEHPLAVPIRSVCGPTRQVFDADCVAEALTVRTRRDGDRFTPFGMDSPKKLKDYFIDRKVALPERDDIPLVCSGDAIAWVVGHTVDAQFAVTTSTSRILVIEVIDALE